MAKSGELFSQKCYTIDFSLRSKYTSDIIAQGLFRNHLNIYDGAFAKIVNGWKLLTMFAKIAPP